MSVTKTLDLEQNQYLFMFLTSIKTKFMRNIFNMAFEVNLQDVQITFGDGQEWDADMDGSSQIMTRLEQFDNSMINNDSKYPHINITKRDIIDITDIIDMSVNDSTGKILFKLIDDEKPTEELEGLVETIAYMTYDD
jgi:hypothetical protein